MFLEECPERGGLGLCDDELDEGRAIEIDGFQSVRPSDTSRDGAGASAASGIIGRSSRSASARRSSPSRSSLARPAGIVLSSTATGRPRSVTSMVSPAATLRRMALASLRSSRTPTRSMCDMVAHASVTQRPIRAA